jgi:hypothetical protein
MSQWQKDKMPVNAFDNPVEFSNRVTRCTFKDFSITMSFIYRKLIAKSEIDAILLDGVVGQRFYQQMIRLYQVLQVGVNNYHLIPSLKLSWKI